MLPSRGISSRISPASALRHSTKLPRLSHNPPRQFSQLSSQSRNAPIIRGAPRLGSIGAHGSSLASLRAGVSAVGGGASTTVFANRAGASRNLSLWPFGSKNPSGEIPIESAATTPSPPPSGLEAAAPTTPSAASPDIPSTSSTSTIVEPVSPSPSTETTLDSTSTSLDNLDFTSILDIPEQIGYLKSLGLDFGWGPTASCEWLLEHIYVYTGLPWWGTLLAVAALYRAVMFVPTLKATRSSALLQAAQKNPEYQQAAEDFKMAAYRTRDQPAMMQARQRMKAVTSKAGINYWWMPVPFLTVPFSFGMFRLMRGMSALPVPSLETGGFAWFTDLTIHDPFYILPIANVVMGVLMFKQNQKANLNQNPTQAAMMKSMMYIFPPVIFLSTAWIPAGLQWFFICLTATTVVQTTATLNPAIRRWAQMPALPSSSSPRGITYQAPNLRPGGGEEGKDGDGGIVKNITKGVRQSLGQDDQKKAWEKAQDYEARRAAEEKEKAWRRMEDARRRRSQKKNP